MRLTRSIILIYLLVASFTANARCSNTGYHVWPQGSTLSTTPVIMLNGYGTGSTILQGIGKQRSIFLASNTDTVTLLIKDTLLSSGGLTQAILTPAKALISGNTYRLCITRLDILELGALTRENPITLQHGAIEWRVGSVEDTTPPTLSAPVLFIDHSIQYYGCGPSEYLNYKVQTTEQSETLIKTTVTHVGTKQQYTYYIMPKHGMVSVGHNMCGGEFYFREDESYKISFTAVLDASGNTAKLLSPPFYFTKPKQPESY